MSTAGSSRWPSLRLACLVAVSASFPVAARADCPALPPAYSAGCASGGTCAVACATGYVGTPTQSSITCDGTDWSIDPSTLSGCTVVTCGAPFPPPSAYVLGAGCQQFGCSLPITCDAERGYIGAPAIASIECSAAGVWSPNPSVNSGCALAQCGANVAPVGYTASCNRTSFGGTCTFGCDTGSGYVGTPSAASSTCQLDQTWSGSAVSLSGCTLHDCGPLNLENADVADCTARSRYGEGCTVSCLAGFRGSPTATCKMTGWDTSGACTLEPEGRGCARPYALALGTPASFALDDQADALSTETCAGDVSAGKDVFLSAAVTAGDYTLAVDAGSASAVQVVVLDGCSSLACEPIALQGDGASFHGTLRAPADGTLLLAVHVLDAPAGGSASITLESVEPPGGSGGGCSTGSIASSLLSIFAALAALGARRRARR